MKAPRPDPPREIESESSPRLGQDIIRTGWHLDSFDQDDQGVTARFMDRATRQPAGEARGDILIGAEGIHSVVRRTFYPQEGTPPFSGRSTKAHHEN